MEKFNFENLIVYQKSLNLSKLICVKAGSFPQKFSRISDQLIGAIISVPLNIAEGSGRLSSKDKMNFYKTSRSSVYEVAALLDITFNLKLISEIENDNWRKEIIIIAKMISSLMNKLK